LEPDPVYTGEGSAAPACASFRLRSFIMSASAPDVHASDFASAFPNSSKVMLEQTTAAGVTVRVPMREIALSGGEPPLRVYDTSGPRGFDVGDGLPWRSPMRRA
jgi:ThiC-associated domain